MGAHDSAGQGRENAAGASNEAVYNKAGAETRLVHVEEKSIEVRTFRLTVDSVLLSYFVSTDRPRCWMVPPAQGKRIASKRVDVFAHLFLRFLWSNQAAA